MEREYEIFEEYADGSAVRRFVVHGLHDARVKLNQLADRSTSEFFAIHRPSKEIVARVKGHDYPQGPFGRVS